MSGSFARSSRIARTNSLLYRGWNSHYPYFTLDAHLRSLGFPMSSYEEMPLPQKGDDDFPAWLVPARNNIQRQLLRLQALIGPPPKEARQAANSGSRSGDARMAAGYRVLIVSSRLSGGQGA